MKWSDFQSVIQLAIALNCAFATLAPFLGNASQRDRRLANEYRMQLENYEITIENDLKQGDNTAALNKDIANLITTVDGITGDSHAIDDKIINFLNGKIRTVCMLFSSLSLITLFYSSYFSSDSINYAFNFI